MSTLSDDLWAQVGLHLKPRHLFKLILTCKRIRRVVDTERYWNRVAAQLVWRACEQMELEPREFPQDGDRLPPIDEAYNLFHLIGLDRGYYHGMEMFLRRIQATIDAYGQLKEEPGPWFAGFHAIPGLRERTLRLYMDTASTYWYGIRLPKPVGDEETISMKEMARRITLLEWVECKNPVKQDWPKIQQFIFDLEDDPMPGVYKRRFFRRLGALVWDLDRTYDAPEQGLPMLALAVEACIF